MSFFRGFAGTQTAIRQRRARGETGFLGDVFEGVALSDPETVQNRVNLAREEQAKATTQLAISRQAIEAEQARFEARLNAATFDAQVQELTSKNRERVLSIKRQERLARQMTEDIVKLDEWDAKTTPLEAAGRFTEALAVPLPDVSHPESLAILRLKTETWKDSLDAVTQKERARITAREEAVREQQIRAGMEAIPRMLATRRFAEANNLNVTIGSDGFLQAVHVKGSEPGTSGKTQVQLVRERSTFESALEKATDPQLREALQANIDAIDAQIAGSAPEAPAERQLQDLPLPLLQEP